MAEIFSLTTPPPFEAAVGGGGGGDVVYVPTAVDTPINSISDVIIVTRDVDNVAVGDQIMIEGSFIILNNSAFNRVFTITIDFDDIFDVEFSTGPLPNSSTLMYPYFFKAHLSVRASDLSYATFRVACRATTGIASGEDTTATASVLGSMGWGETVSDLAGTCTVNLKIRSSSPAATQTCRLVNCVIRKVSPTL